MVALGTERGPMEGGVGSNNSAVLDRQGIGKETKPSSGSRLPPQMSPVESGLVCS